MIVVLFLEFIFLCLLVFLILRELIAFKRTAWYAVVSTWIGWFLCFAIVAILPLDIVNSDFACSTTNPDCKEPWYFVPESTMTVQWRVLYWGTFVLSWAIFPLLQNYWLAGDFSVGERVIRSIKENVILYAILGALAVSFVLGLLIVNKLTFTQLINLIMVLANIYGLVLVVLLMGYGLVDIPRKLFITSDRNRTMRNNYLKAVSLKESLEKAQNNLTKTLKQVRLIADKVREHDPYRPYVDKIISKCPMEYEHIDQGEGDGELTYAKLASLHAKVKDAQHSAQRAAILYEMLVKQTLEEEDIIASYNAPDRVIHWAFKPPRTSQHAVLINKLEWVWHVLLYPWVFRILFLLTTCMSILIVWCEITLPATQDLSPFSHMISSAHLTGFGKQLFTFIPLAYMTLCAYTSLFKVRVFDFYVLVRHHMTDANSIMFSANYLCRLAAPLAFNFLSIVNQADNAFNLAMGDMNAFSGVKQFRTVFPVLVVVVCIMAIFKVFSRIAACCCIKSLRYEVDESPVAIERGRAIIEEERNDKMGGNKTTNKSIKHSVFARFAGMKTVLTSVRTESGDDSGEDGASINGSSRLSSSKPTISAKPASSLPPSRSAPSLTSLVATPSTHINPNSGYSSSGYSSTSTPATRPSNGGAAVLNSSARGNPPSSSSASSSTGGSFFSRMWGGSKASTDGVELLPHGTGRSDL